MTAGWTHTQAKLNYRVASLQKKTSGKSGDEINFCRNM